MAAYHPAMMVRMLLYGYCRGVVSSRKIERATREQAHGEGRSAATNESERGREMPLTPQSGEPILATFRRKNEGLSLAFSSTRRSKAWKVEQIRGHQAAPNITESQCFCRSGDLCRLEDQYWRGPEALVRPGRRPSVRRMKILDLTPHFCARK
jgi:Transposase domain (DUF772)